MSPDLTPILDQLKTLYTSATPLFKALGNLMILVLDLVTRLIREGLSRLS